jgi:hypothetical protein
LRGIVRNYEPSDLERVKEIHAASGIDYRFPDLSSPLFIVKKVLVVDGIVRQCGALYVQCEAYLFSDSSEWGTPEEKLEGIKAIDAAGIYDAWLAGVNDVVLWLPPNMARFGERLVDDLGFERDREGWYTYSKPTYDAG